MTEEQEEALRMIEIFLEDPDPAEAYDLLLDVYKVLKNED